MIVSNSNQNPLYVNPPVALLPAWTETITPREMFKLVKTISYRDTPRSRWEARRVIGKTGGVA